MKLALKYSAIGFLGLAMTATSALLLSVTSVTAQPYLWYCVTLHIGAFIVIGVVIAAPIAYVSERN